MYPFLRMARIMVMARKRPALALDGVSEISMRCWPWDLDMFLELNNGRALSLYDLGRFDLAARIGLIRALRQKRWGLAVAGGSTRFRKRVRLWDKITIRTRAVGQDDRWIYLAQSMWVQGEPVSAIMLRTCVTTKGRIVPTEDVGQALGAEDWSMVLPPWVQAWTDADAERPWPPIP